MLGKLIPVLLALIGLGAGVGAGYFLRPATEEHTAEKHATDSAKTPQMHEADHGDGHGDKQGGGHGGGHGEPGESEYVKLNNQFIVPIMHQGRVSSLVIMSLSLEVRSGMTEKVYAVEPKLRDNLLQVLFDHANVGGFEGTFTDTAKMELLRRSLTEAARQTLGHDVTAVLVSDIVRQDT